MLVMRMACVRMVLFDGRGLGSPSFWEGCLEEWSEEWSETAVDVLRVSVIPGSVSSLEWNAPTLVLYQVLSGQGPFELRWYSESLYGRLRARSVGRRNDCGLT
jgi:hypothetical protein